MTNFQLNKNETYTDYDDVDKHSSMIINKCNKL